MLLLSPLHESLVKLLVQKEIKKLNKKLKAGTISKTDNALLPELKVIEK